MVHVRSKTLFLVYQKARGFQLTFSCFFQNKLYTTLEISAIALRGYINSLLLSDVLNGLVP